MRTPLSYDIREDRRPDRVGQGMEDPFYRNDVKRWMK